MTRGLFVTSTGTDIGKTYVTALIIRQLKAKGLSVHAIKPVLSGFDESSADASDAGILLGALDIALAPAALDAVSPWRYRAALAPDMAARREGKEVPYDEVLRFCRDALRRPENAVLIEGAGGVMAPVSDSKLNLDLIEDLAVPVLMVVGSYLGTISHSLTAAAALTARRTNLAGIVVDESEDAPVSPAETADAIGRHLRGVPLIALRRGAASEAPDLAWLVT